MPNPIRGEMAVVVPVSPERLWPLVADTDRMDRAAGLPPAVYVRASRAEGGETVVGEYRLAGVPYARWIEHPFEWLWPRRFAVSREYQVGPLRRFYGGSELTPVAGGTRVRSFVELTPRSGLLAPLVRFGLIPVGLRRAAAQHRRIAAFLRGQAPTPFPALVQARTPVNQGRLDQITRHLMDEGAPAAPTQRMVTLLREAPDEEVVGLRPLALAADWGTAPAATVEVFLRATLAGLLSMQWELRCPSCRGVKATAARLAAVPTTGECPACHRHLVADQDDLIEARFYPAVAVRPVELGTYCVGSPVKTPHRLAQVTLAPGERRAWPLALPPGAYRLRSPQSPSAPTLTVGPRADPPSMAPVIDAASLPPTPLALPADGGQIQLRNPAAYPVTLAIDDERWPATSATPGRLLTQPAFRRFFSAEALAPGIELAVERVGLLFTDLTESTALYQRLGDARAFRLVGEHLTLLRDAIEAAGGAVVKTIGDAVMAAFPEGRSALRAALAIQHAIRALDTAGLADPRALIKIGVHAGPCFVVTLYDRLDYFGTTVNLAARAQSEARGGQIVATPEVMAEIAADLPTLPIAVETFTTVPRGFEQPVQFSRLHLRETAPTSDADPAEGADGARFGRFPAAPDGGPG